MIRLCKSIKLTESKLGFVEMEKNLNIKTAKHQIAPAVV